MVDVLQFFELSSGLIKLKLLSTQRLMKKIFLLLFITILYAPQADGQTPQKIHDLKSLTDSDGTVHLFYRINAEYEGTEYFTDNIYHYNTDTGVEELFLEHYYDRRFGFEYQYHVNDYKFFENNPEKYISAGSFGFEFGYIERYNTLAFEGFLTFPSRLFVSGTDTSIVYANIDNQRIKSFDGGKTWPEDEEFFEETIPDSLILHFPLISLSPYDDHLMFGRKFFHSDGENAFLRSIDKGETSELISDTLLPNQIQFDADTITIYAFAKTENAESSTNCSIEPCSYGLFVNQNSGEPGLWNLIKTVVSKINSPLFPTMVADPTEPGSIYLWNSESVLVSDNYGEHFEMLVNTDEEITGFTSSIFGEFYTTISTLYKMEGDQPVEVLSIPVSNESITDIPLRNQLLQNYPNPFNPVTTIVFEMRISDFAKIDLYTITGRWIKELINEFKMEGTYRIQLDGSDLSSGTYILRARLGVHTQSRTISLIK